MISHFIEGTNDFNYGKFLLLRFDTSERQVRTALTGFEGHPLFTFGGQRKLNPRMTLVVDLQTGEGAAFSLDPMSWTELGDKHRIWVCPMYEPFLRWLCQQGLDNGGGDITALPRCVQLDEAESSLFGHRREGRGPS
jgi:hypothetical protein